MISLAVKRPRYATFTAPVMPRFPPLLCHAAPLICHWSAPAMPRKSPCYATQVPPLCHANAPEMPWFLLLLFVMADMYFVLIVYFPGFDCPGFDKVV